MPGYYYSSVGASKFYLYSSNNFGMVLASDNSGEYVANWIPELSGTNGLSSKYRSFTLGGDSSPTYETGNNERITKIN